MGDKDNILIDIPRSGGGTNVNGDSFEKPKIQADFNQALSCINSQKIRPAPPYIGIPYKPSRVFHINKKEVLNMSDEDICLQNGMNGLCRRKCELYCNGCEHQSRVPEFDIDLGSGEAAKCYRINGEFFEWVAHFPYFSEIRVAAYSDDVTVSVNPEVSFDVIEKIVKRAKEVHEVLKKEHIGD